APTTSGRVDQYHSMAGVVLDTPWTPDEYGLKSVVLVTDTVPESSMQAKIRDGYAGLMLDLDPQVVLRNVYVVVIVVDDPESSISTSPSCRLGEKPADCAARMYAT